MSGEQSEVGGSRAGRRKRKKLLCSVLIHVSFLLVGDGQSGSTYIPLCAYQKQYVKDHLFMTRKKRCARHEREQKLNICRLKKKNKFLKNICSMVNKRRTSGRDITKMKTF